jgi:hypothetical protein
VQSRRPWAYTAAPLENLQNLEHEADAFDLGNDEDDWFVEPASFVVTADHDPGRDDGGLLGRRFCWSGWEVVGDCSEPTRRMPIRRDTATAGGGVSGAVGPAGQTSDRARYAVSSTGLLWRQGVAGFAVQTSDRARYAVSSTGLLWRRGVAGFAVLGTNEWSVVDTSIGAHGQQR